MKTEADLEESHTLHSVTYDPKLGYPAGVDLYYRCPKCGTYMASNPASYDEAECGCGYLYIDIDAGRFSTRGFEARIEPELVRAVPKPPA